MECKEAYGEGKVRYNYHNLYGYIKGADGKPEIVPEQAKIIRMIYDLYLDGLSMKRIANQLNEGLVPTKQNGKWTEGSIFSILRNEKYVGDALLQKTYTVDCITHKNRLLIKVNSILDGLSFNGVSAAVFEESLNKIANYIGYGSSRPEKENGEGPDNLWCLGNGHYLVIECKNCTTTNTICKSDCNQLNGSIQWFETEYKNNGFLCTPIMIHNSNVFNNDCFPNENARIITPKKLDELKQAIKSFVQAYVNSSCNDNKKIKELLGYYKLNPESIVSTYSEHFGKC